jgi:hypothetical protein
VLAAAFVAGDGMRPTAHLGMKGEVGLGCCCGN